MGPCAGGAVYSPAITDFIIMVDKTSHMFITGPDVIKTVTGEDVRVRGARRRPLPPGQERGRALHGGRASRRRSSSPSSCCRSCPATTSTSRRSSPATPSTSVTADDRALDTIIPDSANQPYDMHTVIEAIVDDGDFLEVQPLFAPNIIIGFGRVDGRSVGVVANQPMQFAGTLDIDASEKAARFVRTCDAFNVPVLTLVDVPGFLPGTDQEWDGIIRRGAKLIYAYAEATVPLVTVITRKAYGGAYDVMGSKHLGADVNLAWPTAQIAVMGAQGAVNILHRKEIAEATERGDLDADQRGPHRAVRGHPAQPLPGRRARLHRRRDRAVGHARAGDAGTAHAAHQARQPAAEEAREHPAVTGSAPERCRPAALRVVRGNPDAGRAGRARRRCSPLEPGTRRDGGADAERSLWASRSRQVRPPLRPGTGAWRASALPR